MQSKSVFKFLNLQLQKRKNSSELPVDEQHYAIVNLLDENNNPVRFFVFKKEIIEQLLSQKFETLQEVEVTYECLFLNNNWTVRLVNING